MRVISSSINNSDVDSLPVDSHVVKFIDSRHLMGRAEERKTRRDAGSVSRSLPPCHASVRERKIDLQSIGRFGSSYVSYSVDSVDGLRSRNEFVWEDGDDRIEG